MLIRLRTKRAAYKLDMDPSQSVLELRQAALRTLVEKEGVEEYCLFGLSKEVDGQGELGSDAETLEVRFPAEGAPRGGGRPPPPARRSPVES